MGRAPETKSERGAWNRAAAELRDVDATPELLEARAAEYRRRWPSVDLTPPALAKHWGALAQPSAAGPDVGPRTRRNRAAASDVIAAATARRRRELPS